jgi:hypothetical protein
MNKIVDWVFTYPDAEAPGGHTWVKVPDTYYNKKMQTNMYTTKVFFRNGVVQNFERRIPVEERQLIKQSVIGLAAIFKHYTGKTVTTSNYFKLRSLFYQYIYRSFDPEQVINDARDLIGKTIYEDPLQLQLMFDKQTKQQDLEDMYARDFLQVETSMLESLIQLEYNKEFIEWPKYNGMKRALAALKEMQEKGESYE